MGKYNPYLANDTDLIEDIIGNKFNFKHGLMIFVEGSEIIVTDLYKIFKGTGKSLKEALISFQVNYFIHYLNSEEETEPLFGLKTYLWNWETLVKEELEKRKRENG